MIIFHSYVSLPEGKHEGLKKQECSNNRLLNGGCFFGGACILIFVEDWDHYLVENLHITGIYPIYLLYRYIDI